MAGNLISCHPEHLESSKHTTQASQSSRASWFYPFIVIAAGILTYIPWLGTYGLLDPTDSFFLESGRELVEKNQFLLPLNNYVPWLDKPILFFWMVAGSYKCFGINPFIGRLPAALSAIACAIIIYFGSRPMLKPRTAALAALIFLATPICSIMGHVCLTDMTLCALIAGSILYLFKGLEYESTKDRLLGYLFLALALLCKGPIAIILCGLAFLPYLISINPTRREFFENLLKLKPISGTAIILALNLPWYILASLATNGEFLVAFFITQNFGRMVGTVNHQEPFYFYIPVFFGGFFPWCTLGLSTSGLLKKTVLRKRSETSKCHRFFRLSLFWFLSVIALFSAIKTKLPTYILPAAPAFAILVTMQLEILGRAGKLRRLVAATALITLALAVALLVHPLMNAPALARLIHPLKGYVAEILKQSICIATPLAISLVGAWFGLVRKNSKIYAASLIICLLLTCGIMVPRAMQIFYKYRQLGFSKLVCQARDDKASLAMIFAEEPSVPWITHRPVARLMDRRDAQRFLKETPGPHYVLVQNINLARMEWFGGANSVLAENDKWHLIKVDASSPLTPPAQGYQLPEKDLTRKIPSTLPAQQ